MPGRIFVINAGQNKIRLDKFLASQIPDLSRSQAKRLIKEKKVFVNKKTAEPSYILEIGDRVEINTEYLSGKNTLQPYSLEIPILYEDRYLLVINKPAPLTVHPARKYQHNTLVNALIYMQKELSSINPLRPGIVHRLDKETSGVMLIAKTNSAHLKLIDDFKNRCIEKEYTAIVKGQFKQKEGRIELPLKTQPHLQKAKISFFDSKTALTLYEVLEEKCGYSLVKVFPKTGRMHQIRAHMAFLGNPILGDVKYGGEKAQRLYLHASRIKLRHPITASLLEFTVPVPFELNEVCNKAGI